MEKEQNQNPEKSNNNEEKNKNKVAPDDASEESKIDNEKLEEKTPDEKILELEDKLARTFAEMENQRRRFEKEKDEAYEYGGFAFKFSVSVFGVCSGMPPQLRTERRQKIVTNMESLLEFDLEF